MASPGSHNRLPSMLSLSLAAHLLVLALIPVSGPVARLRQEARQHLTRTTVRFERIQKAPEKPKAVVKRPRPKPVMRAHRRLVRHVRRARRVRRAPIQRRAPEVEEAVPTQVALAPTPDQPAAPSVELAPPEPTAAPEPPPVPTPEPDTPAPEPERPGLPARSAPQLVETPTEGAVSSVRADAEDAGPVAAATPLRSAQTVALPATPMSSNADAGPGQSAGMLAALRRAAPSLPGGAGSGPAAPGTGSAPQSVASEGPVAGTLSAGETAGAAAGLPQLTGGAGLAGLPGPGPSGGGSPQLARTAAPGLPGSGPGPAVSMVSGTRPGLGQPDRGGQGSGPVGVGAARSAGGGPQVIVLAEGGAGTGGGGSAGPGGANGYGLSYGRSAAIMRSLAELAGGGGTSGGGRAGGGGRQAGGAGEGPVALGYGNSSGAPGGAGHGLGFGTGGGEGTGRGAGDGYGDGPGGSGDGSGLGRGRSGGPLLAALPGTGSGTGGGTGTGTGGGYGAGTGGGEGGGPVQLVFGAGSGGGGGSGLPGTGMGSAAGGYGAGPGGGGEGTGLGRVGPALTTVLLGPAGLGIAGGGGAGQGGVGGIGGGGLGGPVAIGGGTGGGGFGVPALPTMGSWSTGVAGMPGPGGATGSLQRPASGTSEGPGGLYVGVSGSFDMPMGVTSSDYDTDIAGMPNLLGEVRKRTNVHVTVLQRTVKLDPQELKHTPVLHLRGHRPFTFSPQEREALRQYVAEGGTILAEDSHGPFGECFRREMRLIFSQPLRDLPMTHDIYRAHYVLKSVPAGDMGERYPLQGVDVGGRLGVIYSRNDYGDCWEGTGGWVKPESREPAFQMGANLFVYIVAHWNRRKQP